MDILKEIIIDLPKGKIESIHIGEHWTAMIAICNGIKQCGLASNPFGSKLSRDERTELDIRLESGDTAEICGMVSRHGTHLASIGMAAINALLPQQPKTWSELNASQVIAERGAGKRVALIGHFPFIDQIRGAVGKLDVLELHPQEGDLDASETPYILPHADVVAITSMTLINGTINGLLGLCKQDAFVIILGPSTPLSPIMFNHGISVLCGSIVQDMDAVIKGIEAGMHFRQIHPLGVRLVTIMKGHNL